MANMRYVFTAVFIVKVHQTSMLHEVFHVDFSKWRLAGVKNFTREMRFWKRLFTTVRQAKRRRKRGEKTLWRAPLLKPVMSSVMKQDYGSPLLVAVSVGDEQYETHFLVKYQGIFHTKCLLFW